MGKITLKEARKRSRLDLISDKDLPFDNPIYGFGTVRAGEKEMEKRYGRHDVVRIYAMDYFLDQGFDVYPRGVTVNGIGTCPDFAIFRRNKIIFIEILTEGWVYHWNTLKKRRVEEYAPIYFVLEDPAIIKFRKSYEKRDYINRIQRLASYCRVFLCDPSTGIVKKFVRK